MAKLITSQYRSFCHLCGEGIRQGDRVYYDRSRPRGEKTWCAKHGSTPGAPTPTPTPTPTPQEDQMTKLTSWDEAREALLSLPADNGGRVWHSGLESLDDAPRLGAATRKTVRQVCIYLGMSQDHYTSSEYMREAARIALKAGPAEARAWIAALGKRDAPQDDDDAPEPEPAPAPAPQQPKAETAQQQQAALEALRTLIGTNGTVDPETVRQIVREEMSAAPQGVKRIEIVAPDNPTPRDMGVQHRAFSDVLISIQAGLSVMLVGPAGSGKTTLAENVAKALDKQFTFNGAIANEFKLSGFRDATGTYQRTAFREAFEHGHTYLFDEIDASAPGALLAFNAALANGYADFPDGPVDRHEGFRCIAAANTYGHGRDRTYVGRNQLDAATLDRFVVIDMDYDEDLEMALSPDSDWCAYVQRVRKAVREHKMRYVVSTRAILGGAKLIAHGMPRKRVEEVALYKAMSEEDVSKVRASL